MSTDSDRNLTSNALHQRTRTVRAGVEDDQHYGAVIPPLHLSTTYSFAGFAQPRKHDYSRSGNPTRDLLAQALADLEQGVGATVTATGMAAITSVLQLLQPGDLQCWRFWRKPGWLRRCHYRKRLLSMKISRSPNGEATSKRPHGGRGSSVIFPKRFASARFVCKCGRFIPCAGRSFRHEPAR